MVYLPKLRPDFNRIRSAKNERCSAARLAAHFKLEFPLAKQLVASNKRKCMTLYAEVYRQLFASVAVHPQKQAGVVIRQNRIRMQFAFFCKLLSPASTNLEIGCGDAALTKAIAPFVASLIGVDKLQC